MKKSYAVGRIPGSYHKREGKPTDEEVLISRLIDRPIRPLFDKNFSREIQLIPMVLSSTPNSYPDVAAILATSASLIISDIPFVKPIGAVRVGYKNGKFLINAARNEMESSQLELIIAGTADAITMIEGHAKELSEAQVLEAIKIAHKVIIEIVELQLEFQKQVGKSKIESSTQVAHTLSDTAQKSITSQLSQLEKVLQETDKHKRQQSFNELCNKLKEELTAAECSTEDIDLAKATLEEHKKSIIRKWILEKDKRVDGRKLTEIRDIECQADFLANTHGSALFTRGQTQSLTTVTLGSSKDQLKIDALQHVYTKNFYLHYNFPPFSVGETGRFLGPGRREIGHGILAEKSLQQILPPHESFPYTIRLVSEVLESNGSSSMASVCAGSLALMSAGVPLKKSVAGIAMGLIFDGKVSKILTDIQGEEDHLGDMDFKVAGTKDGITGFQLDLKIEGVSFEIMEQALQQAKIARLSIIEKMEDCIKEPRKSLSENAPQRETRKIAVDKIRNLIGPGGKNIKSIVEKTGSSVDVNDDGKVEVFAGDKSKMNAAWLMIEALTGVPKIGATYTGTVKNIKPFGAFVEIMPGIDGLCHISQLNLDGQNIEKAIRLGDTLEVKVLKVDDQGRISLSQI